MIDKNINDKENRIALIFPSNLLYSPYSAEYINVFDQNQLNYEIIIWNRGNLNENVKGYVYNDKKDSHKRNYIDYFRYIKFIKKVLEKENFTHIILFTIQLGHLLNRYLQSKYRGKYILDIRDYHPLLKITNMKRLVNNSHAIVISSEGFKKWLPSSDKYVIKHNTDIKSIPKNTDFCKKRTQLKISTIGLLRHWEVNRDIIQALKNRSDVALYYYGQGIINDKLKEYIARESIDNVIIYGQYQKEEQEDLYLQSDIISIIVYNSNHNTRTFMTNRIYNSAIYGKPLVTLNGNYQSRIVKKYNLGLVYNSINDLKTNIYNDYISIDMDLFKEGRKTFLERVIIENKKFLETLNLFIFRK